MKKDWTYKKLGEVANTFRGLTYSKKDEVEHSSKAVLRSNNIDLTSHQLNFDEIKYIREDFVIPQDKLVKKDSIFICMSNGSMQHLGKVAYIDKEYNFAFGGFMGLVVPKEIVNAKYVYYSMLADNFLSTIMKEGKGANINNLRFSDVENYLIPIPPLSIQRSIVAELDLLHSVISKKKEQLRELDNLAQSLFYQMFGDPITNPMDWEIKKLGEVCGILNGYAFKSNKYVDKGIRVIRIANVQKGIIVDDQPAFYPLSTQFEIDKYILNEGDILMSLTGNVGRVGILQKEMLPAALNQRVACLRISDNSLYSKFFFHYLNSDLFEQKCIASARGIAQLNMSTEWLKEQFIPIPPLSLQQSFAAKVSAIEAQKQAVQQSIREVEALLAERMDNYFS